MDGNVCGRSKFRRFSLMKALIIYRVDAYACTYDICVSGCTGVNVLLASCTSIH